MATPLPNDQRKQMQYDLFWSTISDNELLPFSPIKSENKQLETDNKSFIKAVNEVVDKLQINNATVDNFNDKFNQLVGNVDIESSDWDNLKKIDRNVIRSIYAIYLDVLQLTSDMNSKADVGHKHTLADLTDVDITDKTDGNALLYEAASQKFVSKPLPESPSGSVVTQSATNGDIVVDGSEVVVYQHPANHPASIITEDASHRFVTDVEKTTWNGKADASNVYDKTEVDTKIADATAGAADLSNYYTKTEIDTSLTSKVDIVVGKQLSTEDYTTAEKSKLAGIEDGANNYVHPATHPASIIAQDSGNRFITDNERLSWNALIGYITDLQTQLDDAVRRIGVLEGSNPPAATIDWTYDFIVPDGTDGAIYKLGNDASWTHTLTNEDVYGPGLNGVNAKMKLFSLGVQDGTPDLPGQEVPKDGFDAFAAPTMHGSYQFDDTLQQIMFQSGAMNPYYFRIIKYL